MTEAAATTLRLERTFAAPVEAVFDAWTSEEVLRRWFHGQVGWDTPSAAVDLRLGGDVRVVMRDPEAGREVGGGGHYTEIDRPHRLAFTWTWDGEEQETLIEIDFEQDGAATKVRFKHSSLRDLEAVREHEKGWKVCFDELEAALAAAG